MLDNVGVLLHAKNNEICSLYKERPFTKSFKNGKGE
jgi:hypothetical protein